MVTRFQIALIVVLALSLGAYSMYQDFRGQKEMQALELSRVRFDFETIPFEDGGRVVDAGIQRYSDATYIDLSITASNTGERDIFLKSPVIAFYLEDVLVLEKDLEDLELPAGGSITIPFSDLSFTSEKITLAMEGKKEISRVIELSAVVLPEYSYEVGGVVLKTYRLSSSFSGVVPLVEIFGGKSQFEAAVDILGLNKTELA